MEKLAIFGAPRSGTTWLSQIFNSHPDVAVRYQPLFSYQHKGALSEHSSRTEILRFFDEIYVSEDPLALMKTEIHSSYPAYKKSPHPTHLLFKEVRYLHIIENILQQCGEVKIVGLVRSPLAVLASWIQAPREFDAHWSVLDEWRTGKMKNRGLVENFYGFEKWKASTLNFLRFKQEYPARFYLARYDELNEMPQEKSLDIFRFCGLPMSDQVLDFLSQSKSRHDPDPYSIFRAGASDNNWQHVLPNEIVNAIERELKDSPLNIFI